MIENIETVDTQSFQDMCQKIETLENEKKALQQELKLLGSELTYFKEYAADLEEDITAIKAECRTLSSENHELSLEIKDMKFTKKYLNSEEAGRAFAQELLGGA